MRARISRAKTRAPDYKPPLTIFIHGIMTWAKWQKTASEVWGDHGFPFRSYDFGKYGLHKFLIKSLNDRMVEHFYSDYGAIVRENRAKLSVQSHDKRPSVVAHSFGTYLVGYSMLKYEEIRFDKIIFCGSILPLNFDWATLFRRGQVNRVMNEYSAQDFWAGIADKFVPKTGPGGAKGFHVYLADFEEKRYEFRKHSDYFDRQHMENSWLPFLRKRPSAFTIKHGREFSDRNEFERTLDYTGTQIDSESYGELPHYAEVEIPRGLSLEWIQVCPDIYTFLMDRDTGLAAGYINAMPVTEGLFQKIKEGRVQDNEIRAEDVEPISPGTCLKIYLMSVAISRAARNVGEGLYNEALQKLLHGLLDKLIHYANSQGIRLSELVGVGWTPEGRKLCEILGMKKVANDQFGNPVYWLKFTVENMRPKERVLPSLQKLLDLYEKLPHP
ncbi:MAG TPA: hypothetical protein VKV95_17310 [Terriglobia bacterium]|nr:hypothetical protein [Terriglobia bacterium]